MQHKGEECKIIMQLFKNFSINLGLPLKFTALPINENRINKAAPSSTTFLFATFVMSIVCIFSVNVVEPVPEPQRPANMLQKPSNAIPRLTTPGVGALELTRRDAV